MTKHRAPISAGDALGRIAGLLPGGYDEMARICDRTRGTVYNWGNPDTPEEVPYGCIIRLDRAFQAAGGVGAPLWESLTIALEMSGVERFATPMALAEIAPEVIRETAEASAAIVVASQFGAGPDARRVTMREIDEAIASLQRARVRCQDDIRPP